MTCNALGRQFWYFPIHAGWPLFRCEVTVVKTHQLCICYQETALMTVTCCTYVGRPFPQKSWRISGATQSSRKRNLFIFNSPLGAQDQTAFQNNLTSREVLSRMYSKQSGTWVMRQSSCSPFCGKRMTVGTGKEMVSWLPTGHTILSCTPPSRDNYNQLCVKLGFSGVGEHFPALWNYEAHESSSTWMEEWGEHWFWKT